MKKCLSFWFVVLGILKIAFPVLADTTVITDLGNSSPYVSCFRQGAYNDRYWYGGGINEGTNWSVVESHMEEIEAVPGDYSVYSGYQDWACFSGRSRQIDPSVYGRDGWAWVGYGRAVNYVTVNLPATNGYRSAMLEWQVTLDNKIFTNCVGVTPGGVSSLAMVLWSDYYPQGDSYPASKWYQVTKPHLKVISQVAEVQPTKRNIPDKKADQQDPINSINGNVSIAETDIVVPTAGIPLEFRRWYNTVVEADGTMGPRWSLSCCWRIWETNTVFASATNRWLVLREGEDWHWKALSVSNGGHEVVDAEWLWNWSKTNNAYTVYRPGGMIYRFDTNGLLMCIESAFSNRVALTYTNLTGVWQPVRVEHDDGRALTLTYDVSNRLEQVSTTFTNLSVSFSYDEAGLLTNAVQTAGNLTRATRYYWTEGQQTITQKVNSAGTPTSWEYDGDKGTRSYVGTGRWYEVSIDYSTQPQNKTQISNCRGDTNMAFHQGYDPVRQRVTETSTRQPWYMYEWAQISDITNVYWYYTGDSWHVFRLNPAYQSMILPLFRANSLLTNVPINKVGWSGTRYAYDDYGKLTGVEVSDNSPEVSAWSKTIMSYDSSHRLTNSAYGYLTTPVNAWNYTWNTNWDTVASITDPEGHKSEMDYTNALISVARSFPVAGQPVETRYAYTSNGLLAAVTNANGHWTVNQYDGYGYPTQTVSQIGLTNWMAWDSLGHLKEIRLPSSNVVPRIATFEANELGWVSKITRSDGQFETFSFDGIGNVTNHVDIAGRTNLFTWLPTRKLASTTRFLVNGTTNQAVTVGMDYDQQMNVVKVRDELGRAVETYQLDLQDRPMKVINVESQEMTIAYGLGDMVKQITRFDGTINGFSYDGGGRVSEVSYPSAKIGYRYLKNDLLMTASNSVGVISNAYDGANRLVSTLASGLFPQPSTVSYQLDALGNSTNTQVSGLDYAVNRAFDAGERLSSLTAGEVGATFNYNAINGMLETVSYTNPASSGTGGLNCWYAYDDLDRLTSMTWRDASNNVLRSRSYSYTVAGMISRVDMESGERVEYSYDSLDRLTSENRMDPYGQILVWDTYEYDLAGNRTKKSILDASGSPLLTVNNALATGNRLASWNVPESNLIAKFPVVGTASETIGTNDHFGYLWVSNATAGGMAVKPEVNGTNFWTHDFTVGVGTQKIVAAIRDTAGNMGYTTNTIISTVMTNGAYQYSAAGCLTNMVLQGKGSTKTLGLTWDGQYQLTAVSTNSSTNGVVESYKYDAMGRRVMTAAAGVTNWHVYDGPHVVADLDGTGARVRSYVWGPGMDNLLAMTVYGGTTNTYYALKDHLNSVLALTDSFGNILESYRYDAWGRTMVFDGNGNFLPTSAVGNRYCWQGREYSWKTCLYNFRARWYDPITCRWLSNDPIGISGGLNQYVFCSNNPVNAIDPDGLDVVYLVDTDAVRGAGHAASAVGNDRTGWAYYSFGMGDDRNGPQHLGTLDNMTVRHYKTYEELRKDNPRYDDEICYKSSEKADMAAHREASSHFNDSYWFVGRNCDDVAAAILKAAGVNFKDRLRPNASFKKNRANNEGLSK